ncbi:hypothetical protein CHLNCDRAFT_23227 [Chlorella variabilis]|uniref:TauD/TfdA-like domain-containing protein n=1 Tax=Chlorella variabilis TaxID=554065 RepID=E1ZEN0_CHLVA|nr:hypothetical protein CHLNCDRAFT_23227 [Chlorella variabilis]EFN55524.1 hypothetical protein CHLNCDRAFT_23227 [Chlorella variabilis]|eukprot:XP_005847626.1 hypothetical protein CHLNCDRAFT_23227 [Chlorella variabilis]
MVEGVAAAARKAGGGALPGQPVVGPAAWTPATLDPSEWAYQLSPTEVDEIVAATRHAVDTGKPIPELSKADFPLPTLGPHLERFAREACWGRGFVVLRGFPVDRLSQAEAATAWFGFGLHWGTPVSQNAKGHVLGHVKDLGLDPDDDDVRVYATHAAQPWHVDDTELVALLCLKTARSGGRSGWVSSASVYNRLLEARPDLAEELMKPFAFDRKNEEDPGDVPYWLLPVFSFYKGHFACFYNPRMMKEAQARRGRCGRAGNVAPALQAVSDIADQPDLHLEWQLEPGDVQLLYNWRLHMRTHYEDWPGFENRRHLLRLWLTADDAPPLDPAYYGAAAPGRPGLGIYRRGTVHSAPLDAE